MFAPSAPDPEGERRGYAGGFLERDLGGPVYRRQEEDEEYDEFGRRKWKPPSADDGGPAQGDGDSHQQTQVDDGNGDYYDFGDDSDEANYGYEAEDTGDADGDDANRRNDEDGQRDDRRYDDDDDDEEEESSEEEGDVSKYDLLEDAPVVSIAPAHQSVATPHVEPQALSDEGTGPAVITASDSTEATTSPAVAKPASWDWGAAEKAEKLAVRERAKELKKQKQWEDAQKLQRIVREPSPPRASRPSHRGYDDPRDRDRGYDPRRDRDTRRRSRSPPSGHRGYGARSRSRSPPRRRYGRPTSPPPVRDLPGPPLPPPEAVLRGGGPPLGAPPGGPGYGRGHAHEVGGHGMHSAPYGGGGPNARGVDAFGRDIRGPPPPQREWH